MTLESDSSLSRLRDEREDLRIQISLAADAEQADARYLLAGHARLLRLDADIVARRRAIAQAQAPQPRRKDARPVL